MFDGVPEQDAEVIVGHLTSLQTEMRSTKTRLSKRLEFLRGLQHTQQSIGARVESLENELALGGDSHDGKDALLHHKSSAVSIGKRIARLLNRMGEYLNVDEDEESDADDEYAWQL